MARKRAKVFIKERREHPSFTDTQIEQIVKDHYKLMRKRGRK